MASRYSKRSSSMDAGVMNKYVALKKIDEVTKEGEEDDRSSKRKSTYRSNSKPLSLPVVSQDVQTANFLHEFFLRLKSKPVVYKYLTKQAISQKILLKKSADVDYMRKTAQIVMLPETPREKTAVQIPLQPPFAIETTAFTSRRKTSLKEPQSTLFSSKTSTKMPNLEKSSLSLFECFKRIVGSNEPTQKDYKLSSDSYKEYLLTRYPLEAVEIMVKWLHRGLSVNFDGWIQDTQKFFNLSNEKHCRLAFEVYDFNKDRYICNNDTFRAICNPNVHQYDDDLLKIQQAFLFKTSKDFQMLKNLGKKNNKRSRAFVSAEDEQRFRVPPVHPLKPEALTLDDFLLIQFTIDKPQIIQDLIRFITDIDIYNYGFDVIKPQKRKSSEEIVEKMTKDPDFLSKIQYDPKFVYYKQLEALISANPSDSTKILLANYNRLLRHRSETSLSLQILNESWPNFFGASNSYISQSLYSYFSSGKNETITKIVYLSKLQPILTDSNKNLLAFIIYDRNQDGLITCEELTKFFETLKKNSFIYKESLILVNEFIASIFGKRLKQLDGIDYNMFNELIPRSILSDVLTQVFLSEEGKLKKNLAFCDRNELTTEELESFRVYPHLLRHIELGELSKKLEES